MVGINYLFFGFLALCIFVTGLVAIFLAYCYKQDNLIASIKNKTTANKDEVVSEVAVDINKNNKKENSK